MIAAALGIAARARAAPAALAADAADTVAAFIRDLDLPARLRDVGAREDELRDVAREVLRERARWHDEQGGEEALLGLLRPDVVARRRSLGQALHGAVAEATDHVVVHHARRPACGHSRSSSRRMRNRAPLRSLLSASEAAVRAGTSASVAQAFCSGRPSTKRQT